MTKDNIAREAISIGLNLTKNVLGVDGSAVVPSIVGKVLENIGECTTCRYGIEVDGDDEDIIECEYNSEPEYKPLKHFCAWYEKDNI